MTDSEIIACSFCNKVQGLDVPMIAGMNGHICPACVKLAHQVVSSWSKNKVKHRLPQNLLKPHQLKAKLDEYVIGQDFAKETLSVAVYNHFKRLSYGTDNETYIGKEHSDVEVDKSNVLMVGSTGSGKTFLIRTLAKILEVPFVIADATSLTQAGYVGDDVENVIGRLVEAADGNISLAEWGIVYLDEVDKLARKGESNIGVRDISGEGVQQALLKLVEGAEITLPTKNSHRNQEQNKASTINTENILFIAGGSFAGIEELIDKRLNKDTSQLGFHATFNNGQESEQDREQIVKSLITDDLRSFGLIPEFIGRFHILTMLNKPTIDDLIHILTQPKNALVKQYQRIFAYDNVDLEFTSDALYAVAEQALERGTGARGLRGVIEGLLRPVMYELPNRQDVIKCVVDREFVAGEGDIVYYTASTENRALGVH